MGELAKLSEITGVDIDVNRGTARARPPNLAAVPEMLRTRP
jgi:hypothetical protein